MYLNSEVQQSAIEVENREQRTENREAQNRDAQQSWADSEELNRRKPHPRCIPYHWHRFEPSPVNPPLDWHWCTGTCHCDSVYCDSRRPRHAPGDKLATGPAGWYKIPAGSVGLPRHRTPSPCRKSSLTGRWRRQCKRRRTRTSMMGSLSWSTLWTKRLPSQMRKGKRDKEGTAHTLVI